MRVFGLKVSPAAHLRRAEVRTSTLTDCCLLENLLEEWMHTLMRSFKYACVAMLLGPGLSLATATAANALSNSQEPGSVIIFPYFTDRYSNPR